MMLQQCHVYPPLVDFPAFPVVYAIDERYMLYKAEVSWCITYSWSTGGRSCPLSLFSTLTMKNG